MKYRILSLLFLFSPLANGNNPVEITAFHAMLADIKESGAGVGVMVRSLSEQIAGAWQQGSHAASDVQAVIVPIKDAVVAPVGSVLSKIGAAVREQLPQRPEGTPLTRGEAWFGVYFPFPKKEIAAAAKSFAQGVANASSVVSDADGRLHVHTGAADFALESSYVGDQHLAQEWASGVTGRVDTTLATVKAAIKAQWPKGPEGRVVSKFEHATGLYLPPLPKQEIVAALTSVAESTRGLAVRVGGAVNEQLNSVTSDSHSLVECRHKNNTRTGSSSLVADFSSLNDDGYSVVQTGDDFSLAETPLSGSGIPAAKMGAKTREWFEAAEQARQARIVSFHEKLTPSIDKKSDNAVSMGAHDQGVGSSQVSAGDAAAANFGQPKQSSLSVSSEGDSTVDKQAAPSDSANYPAPAPDNPQSYLTIMYENPGKTALVAAGTVVAVYGGYKVVTHFMKQYEKKKAQKLALQKMLTEVCRAA